MRVFATHWFSLIASRDSRRRRPDSFRARRTKKPAYASHPLNTSRTAMPSFAVRLQEAIAAHSPLCVGIDPSAAIHKSCALPDSAEGALEFGRRVLEAGEYQFSIIKPQSAFFE